MTPRETVRRAVKFQNPTRLPRSFPQEYGCDLCQVRMTPSVDQRPKSGPDEWGAVWHNLGISTLGEVKEFPLKNWADFDDLTIPDITADRRWDGLADEITKAQDKFILGTGVSLYERAHFLRGLENLWMDLYDNTKQLCQLLDILVDMNLYAIERFAAAGADGYFWCDDWGLQDRLMISPQKWREIWKPRYARVYSAAHKAGLLTFLHSCGNIVEILDDLIDAGLDVIQMDQQLNMGLELLGERFGGKITFWCPVDIQAVMPGGNPEEIRSHCRKMVKCLGRPNGGFIAGYYGDPVAAGHSQESIKIMCDQFNSIGSDLTMSNV